MTRRLTTLLESGAFLIGVALVLPYLIGGTILGGRTVTGLSLSLSPERSTVLDVAPVHPHWRRTLLPSSPASGLHIAVRLRNATAAPLVVSARTAANTHAVDDILHVRVRTGGHTVFDGTLGRFRQGARLGTVASHASVAMSLDAWVPRGQTGFIAQIASIPLTFDGLPVGA